MVLTGCLGLQTATSHEAEQSTHVSQRRCESGRNRASACRCASERPVAPGRGGGDREIVFGSRSSGGSLARGTHTGLTQEWR